MLILPAIDILNGKCVRLIQGAFNEQKIYSNEPIEMARSFEAQGAKMLHIVDLDGAQSGSPKNQELILKISRSLNIPIQVGGGIREWKDAEMYLKNGVEKIILGTVAIENPDFLKKLLNTFGANRIVVALDSRNGKIATRGWKTKTKQNLLKVAKNLKEYGITEVVVTDIMVDGTLTEPNFEMMENVKKLHLNVIASGGISSVKSLQKLRAMGVSGAIVGKAIYEKKLTLTEALNFEPQSTLAKRIIPCLDVKNGRTVKGIHFENLRDAGDPIELAKRYAKEGADELVFLDISASSENRTTVIHLVEQIAQKIFIPFTVGGGIQSVKDIAKILRAGADKISLNTSAVLNPSLITQAAKKFGSQCIVIAIDVKKEKEDHLVYIKGGSQKTKWNVLDWALEVEKRGAGEILLTSMDRDGTQGGFDVELLQKISEAVAIPVIASGGAGSVENIEEAFKKGKADAVLVASLFHDKHISIKKVKAYLKSHNITIRP